MRFRKDLVQRYTEVLLPTCPRCGDAAMRWAHLRSHKVQMGACESCKAVVSVQYDDNEYRCLGPSGRRIAWVGDGGKTY